MAVVLNYTVELRNAMLDTIDGQIGTSGLLRLYTGTIPTNANTALGAQTLVAELALSSTAMAAASSGAIAAATITDDSSANATGTVTWGTLTTSAGTRVMDFSVGEADATMIIDNADINSGQVVSCSSFAITAGNA